MTLYIDDHIGDFDLQRALAELSPQRREQALRFRHELGQRQCVLSYLLLRQGLRDVYGLAEPPLFEYSEHGKPTIVGHPDIHFSLSHCREAVACVIADRAVGVDVERIRRFSPSVARYAMNECELLAIDRAAHPEEAFVRLWTMKEARLKLTGEGISRDMKHVFDDKDNYRYVTVVSEQRRYVYTVCELR